MPAAQGASLGPLTGRLGSVFLTGQRSDGSPNHPPELPWRFRLCSSE